MIIAEKVWNDTNSLSQPFLVLFHPNYLLWQQMPWRSAFGDQDMIALMLKLWSRVDPSRKKVVQGPLPLGPVRRRTSLYCLGSLSWASSPPWQSHPNAEHQWVHFLFATSYKKESLIIINWPVFCNLDSCIIGTLWRETDLPLLIFLISKAALRLFPQCITF